MQFDRFTRRAEEILAGVPACFLEGVVGVEVHRRAEPHPSIEGVYTLGECADDEVSLLTDPGAVRSRVHLYHGSFRALAEGDPSFDWERELEETILHEIRHHLEDRAGIKDLLEEDAAADALSRFAAGEAMPDGWYRGGEEVEPRVWRVQDDLFVEVRIRAADLSRARGAPLSMVVLDEPLEVDLPEDVEHGDAITLPDEGLERDSGGQGDLHVVVRTDAGR